MTTHLDFLAKKTDMTTEDDRPSFKWRSNAAIQALLDIAIQILVAEHPVMARAKPINTNTVCEACASAYDEITEEKRGAA